MVNRTRREMLSMVAAGTLTFSGCAALESPPPGVAIEDISFSNFSPEDQTIEYLVDRGDQLIIETSVSLNAEQAERNGGDEYYSNEVAAHEELHERAVYTTRYRLAGNDDWPHELTFDGESFTCLSINVDVSERGSIGILTGEVPASRCSALTSTPE